MASPRSVVAAFVAAVSTAVGQSPPLFREVGLDFPVGHSLSTPIDLNVDGAIDLVTSTGMLLNDGHGRFTQYGPYQPNGSGYGVPLDYDFDGDQDLVYVSSNLYFMRSDGLGGLTYAGGGVFFPFVSSSCSNGGKRVLLDDLDGDGDEDFLVVRDLCTPLTTIALSVGPPNYALVPTPPFLVNGKPVDIADYDGDGDKDILAVVGGVYELHLRVAPLTYVLHATLAVSPPSPTYFVSPLADDLDADGDRDVALFVSSWPFPSATVQHVLHFNDGIGNFPASVATAGSGHGGGIALDWDADGQLEVVRTTLTGLQVFGVGPGGFSASPLASYPLELGGAGSFDVDADGDSDIVLGGLSGRYRTLFNTSAGSFTTDETGPPGAVQWGQCVPADIDGDGDADLLAAAYHGNQYAVVAALNDGYGRFATPPAPTYYASGFVVSGYLSVSVPALVCADLNGDGQLDAGVITPAGVEIWTRDAFGAFSPTGATIPAPVAGAVTLSDAVVRDLDGDGDVDLALAPLSTAGPAASFVLANLGGGAWSAPISLGSALDAHQLACADFDGDGDLDFLKTTSPATFSYRTASGSYSQTNVVPPYYGGIGVAAADLDGDGDTDFVLHDKVYIRIWGTYGVTVPMTPVGGGEFQRLALTDVTGDGLADLLTVGGFRRGLGGPVFAPFEAGGITVTSGIEPWYPVDLDRDGDLDAVGRTGGVAANLRRHLTREGHFRIGRPAALRMYGPPGDPVALFAAAAPANPSFALPGIGVIGIDPSTAFPLFLGTLGADGSVSLDAFVPPTPGLVGLSLWCQAAVSAAPVVTGVVPVVVGSF